MPQFLRGYVVRKRVAGLGPGADLSCWGWYLTAAGGPELHFGGHDFFPVKERPTESQARQARLRGSRAWPASPRDCISGVLSAP